MYSPPSSFSLSAARKVFKNGFWLLGLFTRLLITTFSEARVAFKAVQKLLQLLSLLQEEIEICSWFIER